MARAAGPNRQKATKADQAVERTTQELNRLLKAGRMRERARIEQSQQTTYRQQIKNVSEKFQRMLLRPGKGATQHAPANLVGAVWNFCELFNDSEMRRAARCWSSASAPAWYMGWYIIFYYNGNAEKCKLAITPAVPSVLGRTASGSGPAGRRSRRG